MSKELDARDRMIVSQQLRLQKLEDYFEEHQAMKARVRGMIVSIGGPLNDDKLGYSTDQKQIFYKIAREVED